MLECKRCGHHWAPKVADPVRCPKCTSTYWNVPRGLTRIAKEAVESAPEGVDRVDLYLNQTRVGGIAVHIEEEVATEVKMCPVTAYDSETGETYRCGLPKHAANVKHTKGEKI